jgi:hypothetical protein
MFEQILNDVDTFFGEEVYRFPESDWQEKATGFLARLSVEMDFVFSAVRAIFSDEVFSHSQTEYLYPSKPTTSICTIKIQPDQDVWNPGGMSLETTLYASTLRTQADVSFELHIYGAHGLEALRILYKNYRRIVTLLLEQVTLELETDKSQEKLDKYHGKSVTKKLDLYFSGPNDEDGLITLRAEFSRNAKIDSILQAFFILTAIYDSCYHCSTKPRDIDRILTFYQKLG